MVQAADVLGGAAVQAGDGGIAVLSVITGGGEAQIDAGEELLVGSLVHEGLVGRIGIRVDRSHVQVAHAGGQDRRGECEDTEDIINLFHNPFPFRS